MLTLFLKTCFTSTSGRWSWSFSWSAGYRDLDLTLPSCGIYLSNPNTDTNFSWVQFVAVRFRRTCALGLSGHKYLDTCSRTPSLQQASVSFTKHCRASSDTNPSPPPDTHPGTLNSVGFCPEAQQLPHWPSRMEASMASARTSAREQPHVLNMGLCNGCIISSVLVPADLLLTGPPPNLQLTSEARENLKRCFSAEDEEQLFQSLQPLWRSDIMSCLIPRWSPV